MSIIFIVLIFLIFGYHSVEQDIEILQQTFDSICYLGGHPLAKASKQKYGTLTVSENLISFWNPEKSGNLFEIPIQEIKNCTIETKESLMEGNILLLRIYACALKKNEHYIRIEFKNDFSDFNHVIFYSPISPSVLITKAINETRIDLITNKRFEKGAS